MNYTVSFSQRIAPQVGRNVASSSKTTTTLDTPETGNLPVAPDRSLAAGRLNFPTALYFGNQHKEFRFKLPIEPLLQKLEAELKSVPEYESADVRQLIALARKADQSLSVDDLAVEEFINHLQHNQTETTAVYDEEGEVQQVERPNRLVMAVLTELEAANQAKPPIALSTKIERAMEKLVNAYEKHFSITMPPLDQFRMHEHFERLRDQLRSLGRGTQKSTKENQIFYMRLWNPLIQLSKGEIPKGIEHSESASPSIASELLNIVAVEQDKYLAQQLREFHQEYLKKPTPRSMSEVQHLLLHYFATLAATEGMTKEVLNVMRETPSPEIKTACVKTLVQFEKRQFPGMTEPLESMRDTWAKALTTAPDDKEPAPKNSPKNSPQNSQGSFFSGPPAHPYHRGQSHPQVLSLVKDHMDNPLLLAILAYGNREELPTLKEAIQGEMTRKSLTARIKAATALTTELQENLSTEHIAIVEKDLKTLWDRFLSGETELAQQATGKNLFDLTRVFQYRLGANTFNTMGLVAFNAETSEQDRLQALRFIADSFPKSSPMSETDPKHLSAFNKVKIKVLKTPHAGVFCEAVAVAYDVATQFIATDIFRQNPALRQVTANDMHNRLGPYVEDLAPFKERIAESIPALEAAYEETAQPRPRFGIIEKLQAVLAVLPETPTASN